MREFSSKEKAIIKDRLLKGSFFHELPSTEFLSKGKLMIRVSLKGNHRFEFFTDELPDNAANEEIIDIITLLEYLDRKGLVVKYPPPATVVRDFTDGGEISLGDSGSQTSKSFLLLKESKHIVEFLVANDNYVFKATQPLKACDHDFKTPQQRQFDTSIRWTRRGQTIAIITAVAGILLTLLVNILNWGRVNESAEKMQSELAIARRHIDYLSNRVRTDSISSTKSESILRTLTAQVDSLRNSNRIKRK